MSHMNNNIEELECIKKNKCRDFDTFRARPMLIKTTTKKAYCLQSLNQLHEIWIARNMFDNEYQHENEGNIIDAFTRKILLQEKNSILFDLLEESDRKDPKDPKDRKEEKEEKTIVISTQFDNNLSLSPQELSERRFILKNDLRSRIERGIRLS